MGLTRDTRLRIAPCLEISIDGELIHIASDTDQLTLDLGALAILSTFSRPCALGDGLNSLEQGAGCALDWAELSATVLRLVEVGALEDSDADPQTRLALQSGSATKLHISMLDDRQRTASYLEAIRHTVREGDVVVDLGTGTGVLAVAAAQAGARQVYAIEAGPIAAAARQVFERNGVADRITLLEALSTQASLPEPADVILSEIIGHEPLAERVLEYTADALTRLAKPGARVIPRRLAVVGRAVQVEHAVLDELLFSSRHVERWRDSYSMDLSPLVELRRSRVYQFGREPWVVRDWTALSEPFELANIDLSRPTSGVDHTATVEAIRAGTLSGVVVHFDLELTERHSISTDPLKASRGCHWDCQVWLPPEPLELQPGMPFRVRYRHTLTSTTVETFASD